LMAAAELGGVADVSWRRGVVCCGTSGRS
jgi:hypothetical protein